ncbi:MAG: TonB-dependent receptor, partial [Hyphomicrobium sp.]
IILSDTAGGGLRTDIQYRGFDASPVGGRSQGLAVYQNGVRINESFGDTVNLDLIPAIAISNITVLGANPIYGLNAIGGAIGITMKDGFNTRGGTIDAMGGSFGRGQVAVEYGALSQTGNVASYVAFEALTDKGFRDFAQANIYRFYGDIGFKGSAVELHLSVNAADSVAGVSTAAPKEILDVGWNRTFTTPQTTDLQVVMPTLSAKVQATETLSFSGLAYYRGFKSNVLDANLSEITNCSGVLCAEGENLYNLGGATIPYSSALDPIGTFDRINQDANSFGFSLQSVEKARVFDRPNTFILGTSYDHGKVQYTTSSDIGTIGDRFVVSDTGLGLGPGPDVPPGEPSDYAPRNLITKNDYIGAYFLNTFDLTDAFSLTVGGRYNFARIQLSDQTGYYPDLNSTASFGRFNPMAGGTYKFSNALSFYSGYSEANRAPTPAELACSDPANPCIIESFLTDDPPLKQVVSRSVEAGFRGEIKTSPSEVWTWSAGYFRTQNQDDIINVVSQDVPGRGYFTNAGDTLRTGLELALGYKNNRLSVYGSYALVDATFQDYLELPAPNTPEGTQDCTGTSGPDAPQCNFVKPGDHLPGIPQNRFKTGFEYYVTSKWKFGSDLIAQSSQYFFGDESNNNKPLGGFARVDLHSSYDVSENIQVYGLIKNLFDTRYGLFGTYYDTGLVNDEGGLWSISPAQAAGYGELNDARSITPAAPFAAYGGMRIKF